MNVHSVGGLPEVAVGPPFDVFGAAVQSYVEPVDAQPGGAHPQPAAPTPEPMLDSLADGAPQRVDLGTGRAPQKGAKVGVVGFSGRGDHELGVAAKVGETPDFRRSGAGQWLAKGTSVRPNPAQCWGVQHHAGEGLVLVVGVYGAGFPVDG